MFCIVLADRPDGSSRRGWNRTLLKLGLRVNMNMQPSGLRLDCESTCIPYRGVTAPRPHLQPLTSSPRHVLTTTTTTMFQCCVHTAEHSARLVSGLSVYISESALNPATVYFPDPSVFLRSLQVSASVCEQILLPQYIRLTSSVKNHILDGWIY